MMAELSVTEPNQERFRPAIHYTAVRNWLNDPNGLVYYKGLYHLFYQYNPHGNVWGNMSWGHASSPDLTAWTEHPVAITGDLNEDIFSGSIMADTDNTSGFGSAATPPLVAIYTPRDVRLGTADGAYRLIQTPIDVPAPAPAAFSMAHHAIGDGTELLPEKAWGSVLRIDATITPGTANEIGFIIRGGPNEGTSIGYDATTCCLVVNRERSGEVDFHPAFASTESAAVTLIDGKLRLRVYVDRSSVEVFDQDGLVTITDQIFPKTSSREVSLYARNGEGRIDSLSIHDLERPHPTPAPAS